MPLTADRAIQQAQILKNYHLGERDQLDTIRRYWKGRRRLPAVIPSSAPTEVHVMARIASVNICQIVVDTMAQSMFVDGFRGKGAAEDAKVWKVWQKNRMDARQTGIHRAAYAYGASYAVVTPGDPVPLIRGASPRKLTAVYGENPDWPMWALEKLGPSVGGEQLWRVYDEDAIYHLSENSRNEFAFIETREHGAGVTPVVRFLDSEDLDADDDVEPEPRGRAEVDVPMHGQVAPLMPIQDQIDLTTFGLLVAQHYSAFRQRYILGWLADAEEKMASAASQLWTIEDVVDEEGNEIKIGEFSETNLKGYIDSRQSSLKHAATLSQTPAHELIGELVNLSAEALAAAEAGRDRKIDERQTLNGESHEQVLWLAGKFSGQVPPDDAQVVWRETSARSFAATVDALGKLTTLLGIPAQELWDRVPGATQQDIARWKKAAEGGNSFQVLADMLERQAAGGNGNGDTPDPVFAV